MSDSRSHFVRLRYDLVNAGLLAYDSIRTHKLRTFLTLLGVIIGVASVILVGSAIQGLSVYAEQSTAKAFGSNSYLVAQVAVAGNLTRRQFYEKLRRNKPMRLAEARYLQQSGGDTTLYSPYQQHTADIKRESFISEETSVIGVSASMVDIRDLVVVNGRFFTDQEERIAEPVAVIGDETKNLLFPGGSPLGGTVRINGIDFRVIGVLEKLGSAFGRSQDKSAYIPITNFVRLFGSSQSIAIFGSPRPGSGLSLEQSLDLTRVALRNRFHNRPGQTDTFDTLTPDAIRGFIDTLLALVSAVVIPVTCISLVVGGIVIMNIMLVSVTERTREIGIRKSLGARRSDILLQVLIEAIMMASLGGAAGVAIGGLLTFLLSRAFDIRLAITMPYILLAVGVSTLVGVASGWYPASRASKLDPIVALRSE